MNTGPAGPPDAYWTVIDFLLDYYRQHGTDSSGSDFTLALDEAFADQGRSACLPVPPGGVDVLFGSAR